MIVRNEAAVIRRCLDSVKPLIDTWCIVDTGSTDGTQAIIREHMHGVPGELHERLWVDFATNRTQALSLARRTADYTLVIDADDVLSIPPGFTLPALTADSYTFDFDFANTRYRRTQLIRNTIPWRYRGVVHEFLEGPGAQTTGHLPLTIVVGNDGARRQDPEKYRKDAAILERALKTETDPFMRSRYTFYLAQSWRDAGAKRKAIVSYAARTEMGFWQEEVFISLLNEARLLESLGLMDTVERHYTLATEAAPHRAEAIHGAALFLRMAQRYETAYETARRGIGLTAPPDGLFVEPWIYDYGLLDELAISGYWSGHYRESVDACEVILSEGKIPEHERPRIVANANFARRKLLG